ncbi:MAG: hypothetical protein WDZ48_01375, partial [Pirellulales bacterium]
MSESTGEGREHDVPSLPIEPEPDVLRWPGAREEANPPAEVERSVLLATPPLERELTAGDLGPRRRRVVLPLVLFLATCASTFLAGALSWNPGISGDVDTLARLIAANWQQ